MLKELYIRNFVVIESLQLEFQQGFTVFTGETGAGKSIIVDALGLIMGDRADSKAIRNGTDHAEITASFDCSDQAPIWELLEEQSIEKHNPLMIRRTLHSDGRSRAYINGSPSSLNLLKTLSSYLLEIHGQHQHQSLIKADIQRRILDQFADHQEIVAQVDTYYHEWRNCKNKLETLQLSSKNRESEHALLKYQLAELDEIAPSENEFTQLEQELKRLESAETLQHTTYQAAHELGISEQSCLNRLQHYQRLLQDLVKRDHCLQEMLELMEGSASQLSEAISLLRHYSESVQIKPARIQEIEQRLTQLHELARKHKIHPDHIYSHWQLLQEQLQAMNDTEAQYHSLNKNMQNALKQYQKTAELLSTSRLKAATRLADAIEQQIQQLGMPGASFQIALDSENVIEPRRYGQDNVEFRVAANPGQAAGPIAKVASGGELSRVSLAISVTGMPKETAITRIFDEVDSGIGGPTAEIVGRLLHQLTKNDQVYCVTHLAQVASFADHHFKVSKLSSEKNTQTRVKHLDDTARIEEIARMLGGVEITEQSLAHAQKMLANKYIAA